MRRFHYRLRAALTRAEHEERICQMELARREAHLQEAREKVERLGATRSDLERRLRWLQCGDVDVGRVTGVGRELDRFGELMLEARDLCAKLQAGVAAERERLVEMARERRKLETHRDGLMVRHRQAALLEEGKQLDDLAMSRFAPPGALDGGTP